MKRQHACAKLLLSASILCATTALLNSCNVTRVVKNESQYYQKGDTAVVITTKTIETYEASKKN